MFLVQLFRQDGKRSKSFFKIFIGGQVILHDAVIVLLIGNHIKIAGTGQTKEDDLFLARFLALECFLDGHVDGMAAFGSRKDPGIPRVPYGDTIK